MVMSIVRITLFHVGVAVVRVGRERERGRRVLNLILIFFWFEIVDLLPPSGFDFDFDFDFDFVK